MTDASTGEAREMPRYKCHKQVWALKIAAIEIYDKRRTLPNVERTEAYAGRLSC